jgi:hypothetical protein
VWEKRTFLNKECWLSSTKNPSELVLQQIHHSTQPILPCPHVLSRLSHFKGAKVEIIVAAIAGILVTLPIILKFEAWLNKGDDFAEVKEWHNFTSVMEKK